jgi:hypothetical protein
MCCKHQSVCGHAQSWLLDLSALGSRTGKDGEAVVVDKAIHGIMIEERENQIDINHTQEGTHHWTLTTPLSLVADFTLQ